MPEAAVSGASPQASPSELRDKVAWAAQSLTGAVVSPRPRRVPGPGSGGAARERARSHPSGGDATAAGPRVAANRPNGWDSVRGFQSPSARSLCGLRVPLVIFHGVGGLRRYFSNSYSSPDLFEESPAFYPWASNEMKRGTWSYGRRGRFGFRI